MRLSKLPTILASVFTMAMTSSVSSAEPGTCKNMFSQSKYTKIRSEVREFKFDLPGLKIASVTDQSLSTGATLFLLPAHSTANYDARGGSVAAIETTLLDESSYSNEIDGILFAGGSTMGLEATQGVRRRLFKERAGKAADFDFIPSIPGAVVYDYGNRIEPSQKKLNFPDIKLGEAAFDQAKENSILMGRVGAGTSTTGSKITEPVWGGQGAAFREIKFADGFSFKVFTAVVVNAHGEIHLPEGIVLDKATLKKLREQPRVRATRKNTTLSIVITDVSLDRSQLKRLANMVHTGMAAVIRPFHSYTDGDILFAVSMHQKQMPTEGAYEREEVLQLKASEAMNEAIVKSVMISNGVIQKAP